MDSRAEGNETELVAASRNGNSSDPVTERFRGERKRLWPGLFYWDDHFETAAVAQSVERVLGKDEVLGSNPSGSSGICGLDREVAGKP